MKNIAKAIVISTTIYVLVSCSASITNNETQSAPNSVAIIFRDDTAQYYVEHRERRLLAFISTGDSTEIQSTVSGYNR